jgi:hypothetical protein
MSGKTWCDLCGLKSTDPRHKPLEKYNDQWLCVICLSRQKREDANQCKCSGLPIQPTLKLPCSEEKR